MKITVGSGATALHYEVTKVGKDVLILVTGGVAHIGSTAIGDDGRMSIYTSREHRDDSLASPLAKKISMEFHCVCTVCAGFHLDSIAKEDIKKVLVNAETGINQVIAALNEIK